MTGGMHYTPSHTNVCKFMVLMSVTLTVCTSIVSISRRGVEEEIIFPWREGTYLTGRSSSSNSLREDDTLA